MSFSPNLIADIQQMLGYQFMQHAFEAGTIVALIAGVTGYFVVLRKSAFTAHAFSEIGFAGAAGAVLINIPPIAGLVLGSTLGGLAIAALGAPPIEIPSSASCLPSRSVWDYCSSVLGRWVRDARVFNPVRRNLGNKCGETWSEIPDCWNRYPRQYGTDLSTSSFCISR